MNVTKDLILTSYLILSNGTKIDMTREFEPYGYRTMWSIVWTCALTIFACTWATIHPNIPSHQCSPSKLYYKVHLWIVDLVMPELLLLWAAKQYLAARDLTKRKARPDTENTSAENTCAENTSAENTSAENTSVENTSAEEDASDEVDEAGKPLLPAVNPSTARNEEGNKTSDSMMTAFFAMLKSLFTARNEGGKTLYSMMTAFFAMLKRFFTALNEGGKTLYSMMTPFFAMLKMFFTARDEGGNDTQDWTMTQAFCALMGGFQDEAGCILSPYASSGPITGTKSKPTDEAIQDKSKRDTFVKFLALTQTLWFSVVTIYRIQSPKLYATEAEIVTFTFACLSFITNFFWWNKPQGINLPLLINRNPTPSQQNPQTLTDKDHAPPPDCFELATFILRSDSLKPTSNTPTHDNSEFISKSDVYVYDGQLSRDKTIVALLCASFLGSLSGVCHLTIASLNHGLTIARGRIWFAFAFVGSALSFYLLLVISLYFITWGKAKSFLYHASNAPLVKVLLIVSVVGRIGLIVVLIYFTFSPYPYIAYLTPKWSHYIPHPF